MKFQNSFRNLFRQVLQRQKSDRILFVSRLDFWHADAVRRNSLPAECAGRSIPEIEDLLGMGRSARFRGFHKIVFEGAQTLATQQGETQTTQIELQGRRLRQSVMQTEDEKQLGQSGHITEYFLKTADDYDLMTRLWEQAKWRVDHAGFQAFDRAIGAKGLPMIIMGPSPADVIMIEYAGYENFFLHAADFPEQVQMLREVMEKRYEELWAELLKSGAELNGAKINPGSPQARPPQIILPNKMEGEAALSRKQNGVKMPNLAPFGAELVLHGVHWSTAMTPPPVFREHILPYMHRFTRKMRESGKYTAFHADADLSGLLPEIMETGIDVAECFACAPLVQLELSQARRFWKDKVIIWGGLPSTIFLPSCPQETFRKCLDDFVSEAQHGPGIIAGVSDNLMPGSLWDRLKESSERIATIKFNSGNWSTGRAKAFRLRGSA